ncbi:MAG: hypothetical protein H0W66_11475 [Chthoniobacterales bacterium]|nr:hypothetical protein [Chthoniobacterales bacterium]
MITPSVPTFVAPGDQFEVGVTVANNVSGSGTKAEIALTAEPSAHLEIVRAPAQPLQIAEGHETTVVFAVRAKDLPGGASLTFHAFAGTGEESTRHATLSVRPPVPFMTEVRGGNFTGKVVKVPLDRDMYAEFRQLEATVSALPLGLARGLDFYLQKFPYGCSEQITSAAFAHLLLANEADFGLTRAEVDAQLEKTFATLGRRQRNEGAFTYWESGTPAATDFVSIYATHFLSEAKAAGFPPPNEILQNALRYLRTVVVKEPGDLTEARTIAYAIYVLTRESVITTNYILNLTDYLEKHQEKKWERDLTAVYLAGAWSILQKGDEALRLLRGYEIGKAHPQEGGDFYSPLGADAQYLAIVARHFPDRLSQFSAQDLKALTEPIGRGDFNTLSAAYGVWALKSLSQEIGQHPPELKIAAIGHDQRETALTTTGSLVRRATFPADAAWLRFLTEPPAAGLGAFYQVVAAGFDRGLPAKPVTHGLEIYRELLDAEGKPATRARLGEPLTVRLQVRSTDREEISNVAIIDLWPSGFEKVENTASNNTMCDYNDWREDRAIFFASVGSSVRTITYQVKPCNRGDFVVPPPFAQAMYERGCNGCGTASRLTVVDAK